MKIIFKMLVILIASLMITGCVKVEFTIGIHKDKSMNFEIIEAVDQSLIEEDSSILDSSNFEEAEDQGFLVREYIDDSMQGFVLTKTFDNIDVLSTEESDYTSDLGLFLEGSDVSLFSIKKGFLKNTYTAKFKISNDDMSSQLGSITEDSNDNYYNDSESDFDSGFDYSQMMSNMEMNFVVNLPYKVVDSNATLVDNDGKKLTWNLLELQDETVNFEFELYNMTNVYIVVGSVLLVVILVIVVIVKFRNKGDSSINKNIRSDGINQQSYYIDARDDKNYSNNSSVLLNASEENNSFVTQDYNADNSLNNPSNNLFFNPQDFNVEAPTQTVSNSSSPMATSFNGLSQINNTENTTFYTNNEIDLNDNTANSLLSNLDAINYNNSVNDIQSYPKQVLPNPGVSNQPMESTKNGDNSNKFIHDIDN